MLRLLARWTRKKASQFLAARFEDPATAAVVGYRLYLPSGAARRDRRALIVMLHGCGQDALGLAEGTRMNSLAEGGGCAVLYPQQSTQANPLRCWNWFEPASLAGQGEAALLAHLIDHIGGRHPIDARRIYVVGLSAGGSMACLLAVRHSRLFAACAIHSGVMFAAASSPVQALAAMRSGPSSAAIAAARRAVREVGDSAVIVPTLVIHGGRDMTVNPVNADRILEQLRERAEFIDPGAGELVASGERRVDTGRSPYRQQDYTQRGRTVLRKVLVEGLGHAWSGGDARFEFNDATGPDASRLILDFVTQNQRDTGAGGAALRG
jgi:poly(hydroxyalkanoate) depolymerase family esterase